MLTGLVQTNLALAGIGVDPTITEVEVAPGRTTTGSFRVANGGEETVRVEVEIEDWLKVRTGKSPIDVGAWFFIDEPAFDLEPKEIKNIGYQIIVPEDVEGELVAMVFFSSIAIGEGSLKLGSRFGVSVYVGVEGTTVLDAEIKDIKYSNEKLTIFLSNTGNIHVRPNGTVYIRDLKGKLIRQQNIPYSAVIFAGGGHAYPLKLEMDKFSPGKYEVEAVFKTRPVYDKEKEFTKKVKIHVE